MQKFLIRIMIQMPKSDNFSENEHAAGISASEATGFLTEKGEVIPFEPKDKALAKLKEYRDGVTKTYEEKKQITWPIVSMHLLLNNIAPKGRQHVGQVLINVCRTLVWIFCATTGRIRV